MLTTLKYYNRIYKRNTKKEIRKMLMRVKIQRGDVLDIGCGGGAHAKTMAEMGFRVTAVDVNHEVVDYNQGSASKNLVFKRAGFPELELDGKFDLCYALGMSIQFVHTADKFVQSLERVYELLKTNGYFVFDIMHVESFNSNDLGRKRIDRVITEPCITLVRISEIDIKRNILEWTSEYHIQEGDSYEKHVDYVSMRLWSFDEVLDLLQRTGFLLIGISGELDGQNNQNRTYFLKKGTR